MKAVRYYLWWWSAILVAQEGPHTLIERLSEQFAAHSQKMIEVHVENTIATINLTPQLREEFQKLTTKQKKLVHARACQKVSSLLLKKSNDAVSNLECERRYSTPGGEAMEDEF